MKKNKACIITQVLRKTSKTCKYGRYTAKINIPKIRILSLLEK